MTDSALHLVLRRLRAEQFAELSDAQLVERFAQGRDEAAFALLLKRHGPMVLGLARRLLGNEQDAEDVFQAAFLLLARKAGTIRKKQSVASWLHGVVYRLAGKVRARRAGQQAREKEAATMRDTTDRAEAAWRDLHELLHEVMEKLPERYRSALVLFHLEGRTHEEAARLLGCPLATFRSRLTRGRKLLQQELARRGVAPSTAAFTALLAQSASANGVPAGILNVTLKAAVPFAAGENVAGITPTVAALVHGALRTMSLKKVGVLLALLFTLIAGVGAAALACQHSGTPPAKSEAAVQPKEKKVPPPAAEVVPADPKQAGAPAQEKPLPPDLAARISEADHIAVVTPIWIMARTFRMPNSSEDPPDTFAAVAILKGPKYQSLDYRMGLSPLMAKVVLPDAKVSDKRIFFLKMQEHGVSTPKLYPVRAKPWSLPYTPALADQVQKAIPLPKEWGQEVDGLRLGVRLRQTEFKPGEDIVADVYLKNVSEKDIEVLQHRYNVYDYWPNTRFEVKGPDGNKWLLEKPEGPIWEDDSPYKQILKPGEMYIHAVYLNHWPVTWDEKQNFAANLFVEPGEYTVTCTYQHSLSKDVKKPLLTSAPVTLKVAKQGLGQARLKSLLQHLDSCHFTITLYPREEKGKLWNAKYELRSLDLSVPLVPREPHAIGPTGKPISADTRITKEQAGKLANILAQYGYFDDALTPLNVPEFPLRATPYFDISISHGGTNPATQFRKSYPSVKANLRLLQDLRARVDGDAAKLLAQLLDPVEKEFGPPQAGADKNS